MGFELREHTADVAVEAHGETIDDVFASTADGLAAACHEDVPAGGDRFSLSVTAEGLEALLFDYLDELVYLRDVRDELPVDNEATVTRPADEGVDDADEGGETDGADADGSKWSIEASARGVPLSEISAREVKAVTYSEMRIEETDDAWEAYVVLDV